MDATAREMCDLGETEPLAEGSTPVYMRATRGEIAMMGTINMY